MPAPAVRLRAEFSDILGEEWQLNIHDADYAGSIVTFNVGGDAYQLRYEGNNEDRHQPIIGSSLEFSIIENSANITTFIDYLPNSQDGELTVTLRYDPDGVNTLYWAGVILPEQVVRKDEAYPQEVRIIASDDLGNLAGIDFDNDGTPYVYSDGRSLRDIIVKHCLGKIRTKDHWGASDIYASLDSAFTPSNLYGTGDFFSNIIVNSETWLNVQPNGEQKLFSTMEVLRTVCITFNARLFLANGRFWMIPIVSHHDSQTLTYLNYYNDGSYTSSSTVDVGLTLQTDLIKEAGWEYTHQLPLKRVERSFAFNANNPIGVEEEHLEASFNTDIFNFADYTFPAGTQFQISGYYTHSMTAQGGNNTLARLHANFFIKSGTKYHKHEHTYSGAAYYYNFPNSHSPTVLGDSTWTTSSADRTQVPLLNLNAATGDTFPVITNTYKGFGYTTDPLPSEETGIQIQVDFVVRNPDGTTNSTWKSATNLNFYWIELRVLNTDGDSINYVATNALNARSTLDQGQVYIGDYMGTGPPYGKLYVKTGASTFSTSETWTSTTFTTGQDIHRLGVQEVLRGQKLPLLIERGTLYANNVGTLLHMYNVVLSDSRRMGIYQYTYNGRMRNYDIELFHITGNGSDISVVGKPPREVLPPIAPSSTNSTLNDGIVDEVGQTKFELDDLDATVTGIGTRVELLYDTFQPKGVDYAKTVITYESNKTDGTALELDQTSAQLVSASGNSLMAISEASPGEFRIDLQDDTTPTPLSINVAFATADKTKAGLFGLGTEAPEERLHVVGNAKVDGNIIVTGSVDGVDISTLNTIATKDIPVYNNTASTITKGTIVRENGAQSATGELRIAAFNSLLTVDAHRILGVMTEDIAAGASGYARAVGHVRGLNTNSFTVGTLLYASATTAGAWTSALPTASNSYAQIIGWVTKQNATTGEIFVRIVPATTLENLANVKDQPPSVGQVLVYDGSVWAGTTQATYSSIGIPGATPPAGGFKSVWFQDSAGNMTYDEAFTYDTSTNTLEIDGTATTAGVLRLGEATNNGTNYVGIQAPASLAANTTYTLPSADGTSGQVLSTDASGTLSWVTRAANSFETIAVAGQSNVVADSTTDTLTLVAGSNITLTTNATTDTITIAASGGAPAGSTGQIQYNNAGAFGAEAALYYDATNNRLSVGGNTSPTGTITSRGAGTTTGTTFLCEDSGGAARFTIQDRGNLFTNERSDMAALVHSFVLNATKNEYWRPTIAFKNTSFTSAIAGWLGDTNTLGYFGTLGGTAATGGLGLYGASSGASASNPTWQMHGFHGSTAPTEAIIRLVGTKYAGSGSGSAMLAALADGETILTINNYGLVAGNLTRVAVLGSGAMGLRNTAPTSSTSLTVRGHGTGTGISLLVENSGGTARFTVRDDGAYAFAGGAVGAAQTGYTTFTNLTTDRTCDANATTVEELADILGTLIVDLKTKGIIAA